MRLVRLSETICETIAGVLLGLLGVLLGILPDFTRILLGMYREYSTEGVSLVILVPIFTDFSDFLGRCTTSMLLFE